MRKNPYSCDLKDKQALSVNEAAVLFGIGQQKLRALLDAPDCSFKFMNGKKRMILKDEFVKYLKECKQI